MAQPMMPKATAMWLIQNTGLTFEQIAEFSGLHALEIQALADGDIMPGMAPLDPISNGQLTSDEIKRCEADPAARLRMVQSSIPQPQLRAKGARYTPVVKRQDKPDGVAWLLKNHHELSDGQICKLLGTTKNTISGVRDRTHWNSQNIRPRDPVDLGLCTYLDLTTLVEAARAKIAAKKSDEAKAEAKKAEAGERKGV